MAWTKAPQGLVDLFDACLPDGPGLERRRMFGQPCAFTSAMPPKEKNPRKPRKA